MEFSVSTINKLLKQFRFPVFNIGLQFLNVCLSHFLNVEEKENMLSINNKRSFVDNMIHL